MDANLTGWIALPLFLAMSFLLSGMEAGVFALSRLRIRQQMRAGRPSAKILHGFLENPENFLWTIVVGNTLANFVILGWLFAELYQSLAARWWLFVAVFVALVLVFYAMFDLLPKMLFRTHPNRLCLACAPAFRSIHLGLRPLVALVQGCSRWVLRWTGGKSFTGYLFGNREELRMVMQESAQTFSSEERAMINRVLELPNLAVRQIIRPLAEVQTVSAEQTLGEVLALAREHSVVRLPVWETREGRRRIAGLLEVDRVLFEGEPDPGRPVSGLLKPALFLDEDVRLEVALRRLQRAGQPLAVVLGRDRQESGIVSLEDILKTVFGEVKL
jgi:putative hemolysin